MKYCLKDLVDRTENDDRILEFRFQYKDTLVWPFIRYSVFRTISSKVYNLSSTYRDGKNDSKFDKCVQELGKFVRTCFRLPFLWRQKDILYFYEASKNISTPDEKVFHRIYDWFVMEFSEQSGVIETLGKNKYRKDRHVDKRYIDPIDFLIEVFCYLDKANPKDIRMADDLINYLCNICELDITSSEAMKLRKHILFLSKQIKYMDRIYPKIFRKIDPKLVFIDLGCYGYKAYLNKMLHEMGVKTAEAQHGWIGTNHEAYVHSEFLCNNTEYASYMPDYYLGWGEYWLDKISIPGMKIPIGNPQFWQQYLNLVKKQKNRKTTKLDHRTILWIAFVDNDANIRQLNEFISASNNEYYIRIRLHPRKRYLISEYKEFENNEKIVIDELQTIYDSFQVSDYIVAESSTVIYEALAYGKSTFVFESDTTDWFETGELAVNFKNINELLDLLHKAEDIEKCNVDLKKEFFGEAWQDKFRNFVEEVI